MITEIIKQAFHISKARPVLYDRVVPVSNKDKHGQGNAKKKPKERFADTFSKAYNRIKK